MSIPPETGSRATETASELAANRIAPIARGWFSIPRFLLAPVRFAIRRPRRAALIALGAALLLSGVTTAALLGWFYSHLNSAREATDRWHNTDAIRHLSACSQIWSDHPEVLLLSSRVARRMGAWTEAEAFLVRYADRHGEDDRLSFERLLHRASEGDLEKTFGSLQGRVAQGGSTSRLAREALVMGLMRRFLWREARMILLAWLDERPDDPVALLFLGKVTEEQRGLEQAIQLYRRVIALDMGQLEARLRLASLLVIRRHGEEALAVLTVRQSPITEVRCCGRKSLLVGRRNESRTAIAAPFKPHPGRIGAGTTSMRWSSGGMRRATRSSQSEKPVRIARRDGDRSSGSRRKDSQR